MIKIYILSLLFFALNVFSQSDENEYNSSNSAKFPIPTSHMDWETEKILNSAKKYQNGTSDKPDIVKQYENGRLLLENGTTNTDPFSASIERERSKVQTSGYGSIKSSDLYKNNADGTRTAKYPYIPDNATTIEQVEQHFKVKSENEAKKSIVNNGYREQSSYASNSDNSDIFLLVGIAVVAIVGFVLFLFFSDKKHELQKLDKQGGFNEKYSELIGHFLTYANIEIEKKTAQRIVLLSNNRSASTRITISHGFEKVTVFWSHQSIEFGDRNLNWTFPDNMSQNQMLFKINIELEVYQRNILEAR